MSSMFLTVLLYLFHPFYVSVAEVRHNPQTRSVEVSIRVFFDDFEKALSHQSGQKVNVLKPADRKQVDALIATYLRSHFKLSANGKPLALKYIGYEIEEDAAWCYFESAAVDNISLLDIQNDILFAEHPEQINMIHAYVKGKRQSTKLDNPKRSAQFSF